MSKRSDSSTSTTAGSSSPNPPHPTCACSASSTLPAEWSTTPPIVSVLQPSGCNNIAVVQKHLVPPQIQIATFSPTTSFPSSTNRVANSDSPPICSDQNSKCFSPRRRRPGAFDSVFPQLRTRTCTKRCHLYSIELKLTLLLQTG